MNLAGKGFGLTITKKAFKKNAFTPAQFDLKEQLRINLNFIFGSKRVLKGIRSGRLPGKTLKE